MIRIRFLGATGEVGRMAVFVSDESNRGVLLDYGTGFDAEGKPLLPLHVRPKDVLGVVVSHAHLDHCGAVPSLYITYRPPLYATSLTLELADIMYKDAMKLSGYYLPYTEEEVRAVLEHGTPVVYGEEVEVAEDISLTFLNAGHIPGSMMALLEFKGRRILFTGDFNTIDTNLLRGADLYKIPKDVDVVIMEGTYTAATHPPREKLEREFVEKLREVLEGGGTVLIPAFTLGRAQEILLTIVKNGLTDYPILVDGLARHANRIIGRHPHYLRDYELYRKAMEVSIEVPNMYVRKNIVKEERAIIIAPAGMLKGGAALYYFKKIARERKNALFLSSFQVPNTPGFEILKSGRVVIDRTVIDVMARVEWFDFSAHAGKRELIDFIKRFDRDARIFMIHTEASSATSFVNELREKHGIDNVYVPTTLGEELWI